MKSNIETIALNYSGCVALAKSSKWGSFPIGYANRTQAATKAAALGAEWCVYRGIGRRFFVVRVDSLPSVKAMRDTAVSTRQILRHGGDAYPRAWSVLDVTPVPLPARI